MKIKIETNPVASEYLVLLSAFIIFKNFISAGVSTPKTSLAANYAD